MNPLATVCVFMLHESCLALDVSLAGEVIPAETPTTLPRCPAAVLGLINLRGQALAAIDLSTVLELPPGSANQPMTQMLVLRTTTRLAAMPISNFIGVLPADPAGFRAANRSAEPAYIAGFQTFATRPGLVATLLESNELLARLDRLRFQRNAPTSSLRSLTSSFSSLA